MKRWLGLVLSAPKFALMALGLAGAAVLAGCPIYDGDGGHRVCDGDGCWDCPNPYYSGDCVNYTCNSSNDCPSGYSCQGYYCVRGGGDCQISGCPYGETCKLQGGVLQCVGNGDGGAPIDAGPAPDAAPDSGPDAASYVCKTEGVQDACTAGSICLNHNCYIACSPSAGANACKGADKYNTCKQVFATSGNYYICGSDTNLGTECDLSKGKDCTRPAVCIDGYCK